MQGLTGLAISVATSDDIGTQFLGSVVQKPEAILIAGPTASGKSKLALDLAAKHGGEIINTDSMQVYPVLDVLTARPAAEDLQAAPHHLYGHAELKRPYSVMRWLQDVKPVLSDVVGRQKVPIFVGGTGLYFRALLEGLATVPEIPEEVRRQIRTDLTEIGAESLHARLAKVDPEAADRLKPGDGQRIARAFEVFTATGKPLAFFQSQLGEPALIGAESVEKILVLPDRSLLHQRISDRADVMLEQGAVEEVRALLALDLPDDATVLRAIGVAQLREVLLGEQSPDAALEQLKIATRQYAKRQSTWFRNQFDESWQILQ